MSDDSQHLRDLLTRVSQMMHLWDDGLDPWDGKEYEAASEIWQQLLPEIDAALAELKEQPHEPRPS